MPDKHVSSYTDYLAQLRKANLRFANEVGHLRAALHRLQTTCPHRRTEFEADPAGGNDSYHFCKDCGVKV